jgi:catechol 2,3-dioxygenase-like lactoylglutathione lyase family enzyme
MSRIQLALNVSDVEAAVAFYGRLFGAPPAKRRPGYANFAIAKPPLKLVLIENPKAAGTLHHLGVEVSSTAEVEAAQERLSEAGLSPARDDGVCCYADQAKVWVHDPDGAPWETYVVRGDAPAGPHPVPVPVPARDRPTAEASKDTPCCEPTCCR